MLIIGYIFIVLLIVTSLFIIVAIIIEKNFEESHPVMKWWRANVIDTEKDYPRTDNYDDDYSK
jgi:hypothetical protein